MWYETYIEILWRTAHGPVLLSVTVRVGLSALRAPTNAIGAAPDLCARTRSTRRVHTRAPTVQLHIEPRQTDSDTRFCIILDAHFWCLQNFYLVRACTVHTQRSRVQSAVEHSLRANYRERERRDSETGDTRDSKGHTTGARSDAEKERAGRYPRLQPSALPVLARLPRFAQGSQLIELPRVSAWATRLG